MSISLIGVIFFLGTALLFYVLFAGADFGAGILELFTKPGRIEKKAQQELITQSMAPVWEANHVWLIIAIVILFMGFSSTYTLISTALFIPMMAVLLGIVARGCAFTFRHYDTVQAQDGTKNYRAIYSWVFSLSSLWTSFFLGVIAGAMMLGRINPLSLDFYSSFVSPWLNLFCILLGLFTCSLFAFLAAVYLVGETKSVILRQEFQKKAAIANIAVVVFGAGVFASAQMLGFPLVSLFFFRPLSLTCFVIASVLWLPFWFFLRTATNTIAVRALAALIVTFVLFGWFAVRYPVIVQTVPLEHSSGITFQAAAAPEPTLRALFGALIFGVILIFPALGYLLKIFKWRTLKMEKQQLL